MIAEGLIIVALWGGATLVAVDGAWLGSYVAANNDRPQGMPSYFADEREKQVYAMKLRKSREPPTAGGFEYDDVEDQSSQTRYRNTNRDEPYVIA